MTKVVGNWLNDASKTQPEFVQKICKTCEEKSDTKETKYIIKKAIRRDCNVNCVNGIIQ